MKKSPDNRNTSGDAFRDTFSRKLSGYKAEPTPDLWSRIELTLEKDEALAYKERWKMYSRLAAASLALLLAVGGFLFYNNSALLNPAGNLAQKNQAAQQPAASNTTETVAKIQKNPAANNTLTENAEPPTESSVPENAASSAGQAAGNAPASVATAAKNQNAAVKIQFGKQTVKNLPIAAHTIRAENQEIAAENKVNTKKAGDLKARKAVIPAIIAGKTIASAAGNTVAANAVTSGNAAEQGQSGAETNTAPAAKTASGMVAKTAGAAGVAKGTVTSGNSLNQLNPARNEAGISSESPVLNEHPANLPAKTASGNTSQETLNREIAYLKIKSALNKTDTIKKALPVLATLPDSTVHKDIPAIENKPLSKWSFGAFYAVQQFSQNLNLATPLPEAGNSKAFIVMQRDLPLLYAAEKEYNNNTESAFSWHGKVHVSYQIFPKWHVQTGFIYSVNRAQTTTSFIIRQQETVVPVIVASLNRNERGTMEMVEKYAINYKYEYIGIPLKMQFQSNISNKVYGFASGGAIVNRLMQVTIKNNHSSSGNDVYKSGNASPFRNWMVAATGSAGFGFKLTRQLSLAAGAEAAHYLEPLVNQDKLSIRADQPYTFGFTTGLTYIFGAPAAGK